MATTLAEAKAETAVLEAELAALENAELNKRIVSDKEIPVETTSLYTKKGKTLADAKAETAALEAELADLNSGVTNRLTQFGQGIRTGALELVKTLRDSGADIRKQSADKFGTARPGGIADKLGKYQDKNIKKMDKSFEKINKREEEEKNVLDPMGRVLYHGGEWTGASLVPMGNIAKSGKILNLATNYTKGLGVSAGLGATAGGLKEAGVPYADLVVAGGALSVPLIRMAINAVKKYAIRTGSKEAYEHLTNLNQALIEKGEKPIKVGLGGTKTTGGKEGAAEGYAKNKHEQLEKTIKGDVPVDTLDEWFPKGYLGQNAQNRVDLNDVRNAVATNNTKILNKFFSNLPNAEAQHQAVNSIIAELSPTRNFIETAVNFKKLPPQIQSFYLRKMPQADRAVFAHGTSYINKTAQRLSNERIIPGKGSDDKLWHSIASLEGVNALVHQILGVGLPYGAIAGIKYGSKILKTKAGKSILKSIDPRGKIDLTKETSAIPEFLTGKNSRTRSSTFKDYENYPRESSGLSDADFDKLKAKAKQSQTKAKPSEDNAKQSHESATKEKPTNEKRSNQLVQHKNQTAQPQNETVINQMVEELDFIKKHTNPNTVNLRQFRNKYLKMGASPEEIAIAEDLIKAHKKSYNTKNKPKNRVSESEIARHSGGADNTYLAGVHTGEVGEFPGAIWKWPERRAPYELVDNYKHLLSEPINLRQTAVQKRNEYKPTPESLAFLDDFIKSKKIKFRTGGKVSNTVPNKHLAVFLSQLSKSSNKMHARR